MNDSKKLPTIEVGDTVVFRTDLENGKRYPDTLFCDILKHHWKDGKAVVEHIVDHEAFIIEGTTLLHSIGMVAEVIKPTKERMYSKEEMRMCWNAATHDALSVGDEDYTLMSFKDFIQSLNK